MRMIVLLALLPFKLWAQQDTVPIAPLPESISIPQVEVNAYFREHSLVSATNTISIIDAEQLQSHPVNTSLVAALNQVPGIRMEERSPGSFRLSIRGSLLRSPFGVRNVKLYLMNDLPITDASGNTYLNLFAPSGLYGIQILKGPDASVFGANSGGVVLLRPQRPENDSAFVIGLAGGSFGLAREDVHFKKTWKKYSLQIDQDFQRSDGYRRNSQMQRHFVQAMQKWAYRPKAQITFYHLLSHLQYETPGGLTQAQMEADPQAARAPTPTLPGASQQQAGIYNTTTYHGAIHEWQLSNSLRHVVSAFGSYTDFKNPFITNYETRAEHTLGARTHLQWKRKQWLWTNGYEYLYTFTNFKNHDNNRGEKGDLRVADHLKAQQQFVFSRFDVRLFGQLHLDASMSLNFFSYQFQNQFPIAAEGYSDITFNPQIMPRLGLSYLLKENVSLRASVSRGYSPPTLAEVRPSTNIISTNLQAEQGWNYEAGFFARRYVHNQELYHINVSVYHFRLNDAIVRREDASGAEFFVNAGGTSQTGVEVQGMVSLLRQKQQNKVLKQLSLLPGYTYQHFKFSSYQVGAESFSGNWLTGVPRHIATAQLNAGFAHGLYLTLAYNYTSTIPLNDANEVFANDYHLLQARIGCKLPIKKRELELYIAGDNLLNQQYSLGNDINAFGGRYFNPAPNINFLGGVRLRI